MRLKTLFAALATLCLCAIGVSAPTGITVLTGEQVIQVLDETVDWYRTLATQQQYATQPSDLLILFGNRQTADKVVALVFELARANAELLSSEAGNAARSADAQSGTFDHQQAQLDAQRKSIQQEMADDRQKLASGGKDKATLAATLIELDGELAMVDARKNLLDTMAGFVTESNPGAAGANALKAQIDAIAATVPAPSAAAIATPASAAPPAAGADNGRGGAVRYGIWDLGVNALTERRKVDTIDRIDRHTAALAGTFHAISAAPLQQLQAYSTKEAALAARADGANTATLAGLRAEFDTLAWLFKQTSAILLPLSKEQVLLQQYRHNLGNWRESAQRQYHEALVALGVRAAMLAGLLAGVLVIGEIWRRGVLRYAHEPHRRYQMLLIRTVVIWAAIAAIVGLSFVTEIGTFATFAGLLTAGLAVAMQSVLVSVVGYFFLIGKYGVRVGDRIQIGTVVGEVLDLGLVRMHLMELNQDGPLGPTGRVVAFANLVVFQAAGGLFKQVPGASIAWHESTLPLPVVPDYAALKQQLLTAIGAIVNEYRDAFSQQAQQAQQALQTAGAIPTLKLGEAVPQVHMHLVNGRMRALIRYPVVLGKASEIDERVAEAILAVVAQDKAPPAVAAPG